MILHCSTPSYKSRHSSPEIDNIAYIDDAFKLSLVETHAHF